MNNLKELRWHYESRIKEIESYALKIETGRFSDPSNLEDFFACTWVVPNAKEIEIAEQKIRKHFKLSHRRPEQENSTSKRPDSFPFDDLRLYVSVEDDPASPPFVFSGIVFEVQIKTFLQHAWSIAVHDLIYKSDEASWSKQRLAYQVKAMLEHAELSIQAADILAQSSALSKTDQRTRDLTDMITLMKGQWEEELLPTDIRRLAENTLGLTSALKMKIKQLAKILQEEKDYWTGSFPSNLSPYSIVVQTLLKHRKNEMLNLLTVNEKGTIKVLIHWEVDFPEDIDRSTCCNAIFLKEPNF